MKKLVSYLQTVLLVLLIICGAVAPFNVPTTEAATSILPSFNNEGGRTCTLDDEMLENINGGAAEFQTLLSGSEEGINAGANFLACAMKLGYVRFWMLPYFALYAVQFVIGLAGLIAVLMVVLGGYYYVLGGITDDKEKGKTIITYALGGFVLVLTSWFLVNLALLALTT